MIKPASTHQISEWDKLVAANPDGGNPLQGQAYGYVKGQHDWETQHFMAGSVAVLAQRRMVPRYGTLWYIPKGPGVSTLGELAEAVQHLRSLDGFMVKIDPELLPAQATPEQLAEIGLVRAPRDVQYNINTVVIDLQSSEEDILASFKQKTRYNVRLSAKKGVVCVPVELTEDNIDRMYELMGATQDRAGFFLRSKRYFADFWRAHVEARSGQLFFASYEGTILAGVFVMHVGDRALYKDGGSIRAHSDVQAMAGLQWEAMRWLKQHGVKYYDLHGCPPASRVDDPTHPLHGLARFKTGFNPHITEFIGTFDLPLNQKKYREWCKIGERLYAQYLLRIKKRLLY